MKCSYLFNLFHLNINMLNYEEIIKQIGYGEENLVIGYQNK